MTQGHQPKPDGITPKLPTTGSGVKPASESVRWECGARQRHILPDGQDCDWPVCGCDPYASKVLDAIAESGFEIVPAQRANTNADPVFDWLDALAKEAAPYGYRSDNEALRLFLRSARETNPDAGWIAYDSLASRPPDAEIEWRGYDKHDGLGPLPVFVKTHWRRKTSAQPQSHDEPASANSQEESRG